MVVGGGCLGAALARQLHAAGRTPLVCSRAPRPHPGLWCDPHSLRRNLRLAHRAQVWICLGPGPDEPGAQVWGALDDLLAALRDAQADVLCCGPLPGDHPDLAAFDAAVQKHDTPTLRLAPLFGPGSPLRAARAALRAGEAVRHPRDLPPCRPLWAEDAARAALARITGALQGPELLAADDLLSLLARDTPGRWQPWPPLPLPWPHAPGARAARRLRAQADAPADPWPEALPPRTPLQKWL